MGCVYNHRMSDVMLVSFPPKSSLQGSWELQIEKAWKAIWTLSMNDFMLVKVSLLCQCGISFDVEILAFKEI